MWDALRDIAYRQRATVHDLVTEIDRQRSASSLTAAIRIYIVGYYRAASQVAPAQPIGRPLRPV